MQRFDLVAGDPALDLVNTISWRGDPARTIDRLSDVAELAEWAARAGVIEHGATLTGDDRALEAVRDLRESLHAYVVRGETERFRGHVAEAMANATLRPGPPVEWHVDIRTVDDVRDALALRALELLRSPEAARIGACSNDACGWVFIDRTRNHSRRWCSSADCGNRDRASRHYARRRSA